MKFFLEICALLTLMFSLSIRCRERRSPRKGWIVRNLVSLSAIWILMLDYYHIGWEQYSKLDGIKTIWTKRCQEMNDSEFFGTSTCDAEAVAGHRCSLFAMSSQQSILCYGVYDAAPCILLCNWTVGCEMLETMFVPFWIDRQNTSCNSVFGYLRCISSCESSNFQLIFVLP